jgi:dCMP deaminase
MERTDKENYYLDIAETVLERSTCMRRKYGALIVANDEIIATGYNGAPRGRKNCIDLNYCTREKLKIPSGERYELCRSVHAEANAIISAARRDMVGAALYLVGVNANGEYIEGVSPCAMCRRLIINAGITRVITRINKREYQTTHVRDWIYNDDTLAERVDTIL